MYRDARGVEQDYTEAAKWFRKAADQGNIKGQHDLGVRYYLGQGVQVDYVEAMKWFRKAAEQGDAEAQSILGGMYLLGQGVDKNYAEATKWFRKAADQGYAEAQDNLGSMYWNGRGVPKNYAEAAKWHGKAAEQGNNAQAQLNLLDKISEMYLRYANLYMRRNVLTSCVVSCHVPVRTVSAWMLSTMRLMLFFDGRNPKYALPVLAEYIRPNV
jgi:TPR repeat protein